MHKTFLRPLTCKAVFKRTGWKFHQSSVSGILDWSSRLKSSAVSAGPDIAESNTAFDEYDNAKPFNSIPGPKGLPLIGNWLDYKLCPWKIDQRHIYIQQLKEQYGEIVKESWAGNTVLHLLAPEFIRKVYESEGKYPNIPPLLPGVQFYRKSQEMSPGLGNCNGEEWYRLRRVAQQILVRPQKALDYLYLQNEVANEFIELLPSIIEENGEVKDFNTWLLRWGIESAFNVFLEKRMGYLKPSGQAIAEEVIEKSNGVFTLSTKLWFSLPFFKYFPTPGFKRFYEYEDFLSSYMAQTVSEAAKEYHNQLNGKSESETEKQYLFLSYMLSSNHIEWKDVVSISFSVLTDTLSTTVQALLFNLYTLATNPDAQEKAYREALDILPPSEEVTAKEFNSCSYIKACMKETFRFFPIGLDVQRLAPVDMVIGGYQVPAGTYICLENYVPLHDPTFIPEPHRFYPERWLRENLSKNEHPYILIPFSIGTRMCAGRRFAEQDMVMMISKILKHYKLEWHHQPLDQRYQMLQVPDGEVKIKFVPRKS